MFSGLEDDGLYFLFYVQLSKLIGHVAAIKAAQDMARAADFDRKMLLLATQLAHDYDMKGLLLAVLDALLQTLNIREGDMVAEAMILIRCAIRLIHSLLAEPAANRYVLRIWRKIPVRPDFILCRPTLIRTLVEHFLTGKPPQFVLMYSE